MTIELLDRPVWSRSQVSALNTCKRKFALGLKSSRDSAIDPIFSRAAELKKLKNRHLWTGSFLHQTIGDLLKILRQGQTLPDVEKIINERKEQMRSEFKASKEAQAEAPRLFEHEFNLPVAPDIWRGHWTTVETSLRWFLQSKWLTRLSQLGPECWKAVDDLLEFDVNGIKAYVKIDCAIEIEGRFILIDWKTSAPKAENESSLLVAALYAHEVWGAESQHMDAVAVSLLDGKTFHATVDEDALMNTHLRIEEEAALLEETKSGLGADPFKVEPTSNFDTCRRCNFQRLCHPRGL